MMKYILNIIVLLVVMVVDLRGQGSAKSTTHNLSKRLVKEEAKSIIILAKHKNKGIALRWAPMNENIWQMGNQYGYVIERKTVKRNTKALAKPEMPLRIEILPAPKSDWNKMAEKDSMVRVAKHIYLDTPINTSEKDTAVLNATKRGKFAFTLLCADFSVQVAKLLGLALLDTAVISNEVYQYTVMLNTPKGISPKVQDKLVAGLELNIPQYKLENVIDVDFADSVTTLQWDYSQKATYVAYVIERSDDNGVTYQRVNQTPFYPIENAKDSKSVVYSNKVLTLFKNYYYRVRGIDPFGDLSPASTNVKVYAYPTKIVGGQQLRATFPGKNLVALNWEYPDSLRGSLKGFNVYKTKDFNNIQKVTKTPLGYNAHYVLDKVSSYDENLYYIVSAVDLRNKETQSEPLLVSIVDSIGPQKVTKLHGTIDKKGIVKIGWRNSGEPDLYGYNIFRAEGDTPNNMFMVKFIKGTDTTLVDTISLVANSSKVHYIIMPIDYHSNAVKQHDTLVIVRPDVVPPFPPRFVFMSKSDTSVYLRWEKSMSDDVLNYQLYRRNLPDTNLVLLKTLKSLPTYDNLEYTDLTVEEDRPIQYLVRAVDKVGLVSNDSCRLVVVIPKPIRLKAVDNIKLKFLAKEKKVHVQWDYRNRRSLKRFILFRKKDNEPFHKYKELNGKDREFSDTNIHDGTYTYKIIAISTDGINSVAGQETSVKVKNMDK